VSNPHPLTSLQRELLGDVAELYAMPDLRANPLNSTLRFGLIADPQYADVAPDIAKNLYYRHALQKLPQAIAALNQQPLDLLSRWGISLTAAGRAIALFCRCTIGWSTACSGVG
jgi:hypothetical protein